MDRRLVRLRGDRRVAGAEQPIPWNLRDSGWWSVARCVDSCVADWAGLTSRCHHGEDVGGGLIVGLEILEQSIESLLVFVVILPLP